MSSGIIQWLGSLEQDAFARVLRARPDCALPAPRSLNELGDRLSSPHSVQNALLSLDLGCLDVLGAAQSAGDECTRTDLFRLHGIEDGSPEFDRAWDVLHEHALVWSTQEGTLRLVGPLRAGHGALNLGRSLRTLLKPLTAAELGTLAENAGLEKRKRKTETFESIEALLADPERISNLLTTAPKEVREAADAIAWNGPMSHRVLGRMASKNSNPVRWLLSRGLLAHVDRYRSDGPFEMPREVALALRGPDYRVPLHPQPPRPTVDENPIADVDGAATLAASRLVDGVARLLEYCAGAPIARLRAGGVGVRVLRQLAKTLHIDEKEVRLWLEIAAAAELLSINADGEIVASEEAESWQHSDPADRIVPLLNAWWWLPRAPTTALLEEKPPPALAGTGEDVDRVLRHDLLGELASLSPGQATREHTEIDTLVAWRRPMVHADARTIAKPSEATWWECDAVGVTARKALSTLGRTLHDGDLDALREAAANLLPHAHRTALLQADLTAVVRGTPDAHLSSLLNLTADMESRDTASTWRFSHESIRRAFDQGHTAESILTDLEAIADSAVPQPLRYLVHDVARRFGELAVRTVSCCVLGDEALILEVSKHRALGELKLRKLAPTVASSAKPAEHTIRLLRKTGYSPIQLNSDGTVRIERQKSAKTTDHKPERKPHRAATAPHFDQPPDFHALAASLLPRGTEQRGQQSLPELVPQEIEELRLGEHVRHLSPGEVHVLADAITDQRDVHIDYVDQNGKRTSRTITPLDHNQYLLTSWCHLRDDERNFILDRIRAVSAVTR